MSPERTIEKIKKCLALASNNSNENEVKSAIKMAQCLALKSNIDIDSIEIDDDTKVEIEVIKDTIDQKTKTAQSWRYYLCRAIADNFRCEAFLSKDGMGSSHIKIIGDKQDTAIVKEVFGYVENAYLSLSKKYISDMKKIYTLNRTTSAGLKNDYLAGFIKGIKDALSENVEEMGLIVIKPDEVVQFIKECSTRKAAKHVSAGNKEAHNKGLSDGLFTGKTKRHSYISAEA